MRLPASFVAQDVREETGARMWSRALGVDLSLPGPMLGFPRLAGPEQSRVCHVDLITSNECRRLWQATTPESIIDKRVPGSVQRLLTLEHDDDVGYRYWAAGFGAFLVSSDGTRVLCAPETEDQARWQRFFIGQIVPFVAPLQGLEVMHGSAVSIDGRAFAFLGASAVGKTSLAVQFLLRGAALVTDDVLALERTADGPVIVHPGPGVVGVRHSELSRLSGSDATRLGKAVASNEKEVLFDVRKELEATPLGAVCFINHDSDATELSIELRADPAILLGGTFNTVLRSRARLEGLLDVCVDIANSARVLWVTVPPSTDVEMLAAALEADLFGT